MSEEDSTPKADRNEPNTAVLVFRDVAGRPIAVPEDVVIESERPYRAYRLKRAGHNWEVIAMMENYPTWQAARADVKRYTEEGASLVADWRRQELLEMEVSRLDALQAAIWESAMKGNLPAVNSVVSIVVTRTKLLRLDEDIRDDEKELEGRTVVVPNDEAGYSAVLEAAS